MALPAERGSLKWCTWVMRQFLPHASSPKRLRKRGDAGAWAADFFRKAAKKIANEELQHCASGPLLRPRRKRVSLFKSKIVLMVGSAPARCV